ncbi:MAG: hypothetical protein KCHDKBKB_01799 [Elusimicrobia bacterium]|nr:hypothetical protein [Elusimicrobiota bacterium]
MASIEPKQWTSPLRIESGNFTHQMWGGNWISSFKGQPSLSQPVGESWEFSLRPERPSHVLLPNGKRAPLLELLKDYSAEILGKHGAEDPTKTSILVKLIDAREDLSLQVHPSDDQVLSGQEGGGKSEAWLILETSSQEGEGYIYLGFDSGTVASYPDRASFESAFFESLTQVQSWGPSTNLELRAKAERVILPFLNKISVQPGEVYEVTPGTIHALGRGVRIYEIQQSSDVTYRVWDWNRPDAEKQKVGKLEFRALHLDAARPVINYKSHPPEYYRLAPQPVQINDREGILEEILIQEAHKKFATHRLTFKKKGSHCGLSTIGRFQVLTVVQGKVDVGFQATQGQSLLVPACLEKIKLTCLSAPATVIRSYIPI